MKTHHRPFVYESPDFKLMCALVVRDNTARRESFVWHVARLVDWKYNLYNFKRGFPGNFSAAAQLGICVMSMERAAKETLLASDLITPDILTALELFEKPKRIVASLRR